MIRYLKKRPEGIRRFGGLCNATVYFENYDDAGPYAYTGFEIFSNKANAHIHITRWSHNIAKKLKGDWNTHVLMLLEIGVDSVIAVNQDVEDKRMGPEIWHKFIALFGFVKPILVETSRLNLIKE